jgi:uncharacterized membrane protein
MENLFTWGGGMWGGIGLAVLQILALVVILLVCIAFLLLFDRKVWAGGAAAQGTQRSRAVRPAAVVRGPSNSC